MNGNGKPKRIDVARELRTPYGRLVMAERRGHLPRLHTGPGPIPFGTYETPDYVEVVELRAALMREGWSPQRINRILVKIQKHPWHWMAEMRDAGEEYAAARGAAGIGPQIREGHIGETGLTEILDETPDR